MRNWPRPTTAGISSTPAMMAVWLARPPASVAKAWTVLRVEAAVSLGVRSWARTTTGSLQVLQLLAALAEQVAEDALFDVEQVGRRGVARWPPLDALQRLGVAAHDAADGVLGGEVLVADQRLDLADQGRVLEQQGVGAEDGAVLVAELGGDGLLVSRASRGGGGQGLAQALDLGVAACRRRRSAGECGTIRCPAPGPGRWPRRERRRCRV